MWILSCESECLGGKRTWLRPGSESLLGRTSSKATDGNLQLHINHKSVSRTHAVLKVAKIQAGDATRLQLHEHLELEDKSKTGTYVNGEKIVKSTKTLTPGNYQIKLGSYEPVFALEWQPVVLSVTNVRQSEKKSGDALGALRDKLEQAGVKVSLEYLNNETTHVIARKRNTAAGLQALLEARWLVTESFADALFEACKREVGRDVEGQPRQCLLEQDFDAGWPREEDFIVPAGREPVQRPNEHLKPSSERSSVFAAFTFVFLSEVQFTMLLPVIAAGHGKAVLCQYHPNRTTVQDVVGFVAALDGRKEDCDFQLSKQSIPGGIVIVRIGENELGRSSTFMRDLDLALDQRSIEQSEFFGAIVDNSTVLLRQPLRDASESIAQSPNKNIQPPPSTRREVLDPRGSPSTSHHSPQQQQQEQQQQQQPQPQPEERDEHVSPTKRRSRRLVTKSRFHGFDDFDPSQIVQDDSDSPESRSPIEGQLQVARDLEVNLRTDDEPNMLTNKRKRRGSQQALDEDKAFLDELLPGVTALKKRRLEALKNGQKDVFAQPIGDPATGRLDETAQSQSKKSLLEKDIKAEIKKRREREEEERRKDEEALRNPLDIDISELKNLARIETFQLPTRESRPVTAVTHGANWNPAWNGRKNFKRFRPKGQCRAGDAQPEIPKVYVSLEEVSGRDRGLGGIYSVDANSTLVGSKGKSQSQSQSRRDTPTSAVHDDEDDSLAFRRRSQQRRGEGGEAGEAGQAAFEDAAPTSTRSDTLVSGSQPKAAGKRLAPEQLFGAPTAKKSRNATIRTMTTVDDDDDPLAFRRKRR